MSLLEWWIDTCPFSELEKIMFRSKNTDIHLNTQFEENQIYKIFFDLLPYKQSMEGRYICTAPNATTLIDQLFERYVDDDTLVITTEDEHPSVKTNLAKCKNVLTICASGRLLTNDKPLSEHIKGYKKIFVYILGLSVGGNHFAFQNLFEELKNFLELMNKQYKMVIDAVQELFLIPRDYSMFDYVIGTAHALFPDYECGYMISKEPFGEMDKIVFGQYLSYVWALTHYKDHLGLFHYCVLDYFGEYIQRDEFLKVNYHSPYVFNLLDYKKRLFGVNGIPEGFEGNAPYTPMTVRAVPSAVFPERMWKRIKKTEKILESSF